jgi:hypothetical protein
MKEAERNVAITVKQSDARDAYVLPLPQRIFVTLCLATRSGDAGNCRWVF